MPCCLVLILVNHYRWLLQIKNFGFCHELTTLGNTVIALFVLSFHTDIMALCSNDAKSCYDWIVLIVAALCLCCLGADKAAIQSMIGTLHGMQHHMRSTYGDSKTLQGWHEWGTPIMGISQGNGASPQICWNAPAILQGGQTENYNYY